MKKLLYSKKITNKSKELVEMINIYCSKLNKEYSKNMLQLVLKIAEGENLDAQMLIDKYIINEESDDKVKLETLEEIDELKLEKLKIEKLKIEKLKIDTVEDPKEQLESDESFLDKIIINGECYYYQSIENGIVYNKDSKQVGVYKNNKIIMN
jgi:hypothetical protein